MLQSSSLQQSEQNNQVLCLFEN